MVQTKSSITLSQVFEGMILSKQAEGKSVNTINDYRNSFQKPTLFPDYLTEQEKATAQRVGHNLVA